MITDSMGAVSFGLFIVAVLGTLALGAGYVLALLLKRAVWARWILRIELAGLALYLVLFLLASFTSGTRELAVGEEKHICEVDCHLAYAVTGTRTAHQWDGKTAQGTFYVVTVRVRFDSGTIAPWRPRNIPLSPNGRTVALVDGQPRLIALSPNPQSDLRPGVIPIKMTCHSGGSVDIYLEPQRPAPRLVVFGVSPVARSLARLANVLGYDVDAVDPDADRATFPEADRVLTDRSPAAVRPPAGSRVCAVVATMGQWDEEATATALAETGRLDEESRRARNGLLSRQITLR